MPAMPVATVATAALTLPDQDNDRSHRIVELLPLPEEADHLAFALLRRHVAAHLRGETDTIVTVSRLRRINRLWEDRMVGVLAHELQMGDPMDGPIGDLLEAPGEPKAA
jgi:hypothetical protein